MTAPGFATSGGQESIGERRVIRLERKILPPFINSEIAIGDLAGETLPRVLLKVPQRHANRSTSSRDCLSVGTERHAICEA